MKTTRLYLITLFIPFAVLLPSALAQDYTAWNLPDGAIERLGKGGITGNIAFSPDGTRLAVGSAIGIWICDVRPDKEKELDLLTGHTGWVSSIAFSPDGTTLASASWDGTVRLWDVVTGQHKITLSGHVGWVDSVVYSPDGRTLATGNRDRTVRLWDAQTGQQKATLEGHTDYVTSLAFSPDSRTLASASSDRTVRLWDTQTGKQLLLEVQTRQCGYGMFAQKRT